MKKVIFSLPAEALGTATSAVLLGDFNNWSLSEAIKLTQHEDGTLKATVDLEPGKTYEYRFLLDDGTWVNDWNAESYAFKHHLGIDNSVITVEQETITVTQKAESAKKSKPKIAAKKKKSTAKKTAKAKVAPPVVKDDLTKIEGIGPAIAQLLEEHGINSYKILGKTTIKKLKDILDVGGPKFVLHDPKTWARQAKLAAADKWEELKTLQDKLLGGK